MKLVIHSRDGKVLIPQIEMLETSKVKDLKKGIQVKFPYLSPSRQRLQTPNQTVLDDDNTLQSYAIKSGSIITLKDLGPQIGYRTVFIIEYLGPILIHSLFYYLNGKSLQDKLAFWMVVAHFVKRELETIFVHSFTHATMPLSNLFKNCAHYYILGGFMLAMSLYGVQDASQSPNWVLLVLFALFELCNLKTHLMLGKLPKAPRTYPKGFLFDYVSCANYFFEILSWIAFSLFVMNKFAWLFTVVGALQMAQWAIKKHKAYRKEFKEYPPNRKAMVPFVF